MADADRRAVRRSGALIGLAGAIGALGGVLVNLAFRQSFLTLKNGDGAYLAFLAFLRGVLRGDLVRISPQVRGPPRRGLTCHNGRVTTYVAFLRGINLGPTNKVSMPELRAMATDLGYTEVATYINSGNLIFVSAKKAADLEREISAAISRRFGSNTDVAVRTTAQLKKVVADNPYPDGSPSQVTVAFLTKAAPAGAKQKVAAIATEAEPFTFAGSEVYVHYSNGLGKSKLAERFSSVIGVSSTVRNLNTVTKVLALCERKDA